MAFQKNGVTVRKKMFRLLLFPYVVSVYVFTLFCGRSHLGREVCLILERSKNDATGNSV